MLENLFSLRGKRALVTGSSRGIGRAAALLLGEAGAQVVFHASKNSEVLARTVAEAREKGVDCEAVTADLGDGAAVQKMIADVGRADLLILNASVQTYRTVEEVDDAEFEREYSVNVRSSFQLVRGFLSGMRERRFGRIITLGSVNQYRPSPRLCLYASTKAAQNNLVLGLARTQAQYGITANNIAPGVIATDRNAAALADPDTVELLLKGIPAHRFGTAQDCAGLILLLCSEAGSYINGIDVAVDGGMSL